ncbi:MAG: hypothetical protein BJ554DRAFT_2244, partial [Olpidium bornovanus]
MVLEHSPGPVSSRNDVLGAEEERSEKHVLRELPVGDLVHVTTRRPGCRGRKDGDDEQRELMRAMVLDEVRGEFAEKEIHAAEERAANEQRLSRIELLLERLYLEFIASSSIESQLIIRETPEQNGVEEKFGRTIEERTCAILTGSRLPINLWPEIWQSVVRIYNFSPHSAIQHRVPISVLDPARHAQPDVSRLHVLGSYAYSFVLKSDRTYKLSLTAEKLVLVG